MILAVGLWALGFLAGTAGVVLTAAPAPFLDYLRQREMEPETNEDLRRRGALAACLGVFFLICGFYIWSHPS